MDEFNVLINTWIYFFKQNLFSTPNDKIVNFLIVGIATATATVTTTATATVTTTATATATAALFEV